MFNILAIKLKRKSRKYPIKKDEYGTSARHRAFDAFDSGQRPAEVSRQVGISVRTACRYYADWKKLPKNLEFRFNVVKKIIKDDPEFSRKTISMLSDCLGMSEEEVILRLQKPWGLKQLMKGDWPNYRRQKAQSQQEARLMAALDLVRFAEFCGMPPGDIRDVVKKLIDEAS